MKSDGGKVACMYTGVHLPEFNHFEYNYSDLYADGYNKKLGFHLGGGALKCHEFMSHRSCWIIMFIFYL